MSSQPAEKDARLCDHAMCQRRAWKVVGADDGWNQLGQTHDCCSRHCPVFAPAKAGAR